MHFFHIFLFQNAFPKSSGDSNVKPDTSQWKAALRIHLDFQQYIAGCTVANLWRYPITSHYIKCIRIHICYIIFRIAVFSRRTLNSNSNKDNDEKVLCPGYTSCIQLVLWNSLQGYTPQLDLYNLYKFILIINRNIFPGQTARMGMK